MAGACASSAGPKERAFTRAASHCPEPRAALARKLPPNPSRALALARRDPGDMPHLAAGPRFELAVKMEAKPRLGENVEPGRRLFADQVAHLDRAEPRRRAERPAGYGANMLLELRGQRAVDRPMAGIVDARGEFVDDQALRAVMVAHDEHLDRENADIVQGLDDLARDLARRRLGRGAHHGGQTRAGEDVALVLVLAKIEGGEIAVEAARGDQRDFALEAHEAFQDGRLAAKAAEQRGEVGAFAHQRLALAVIAETPRLQDRRTAERADRAHQGAGVLDGQEGRGLQADIPQEGLFRQAVLGQRQRPGVGPQRAALAQIFGAGDRHVLEFVGDHVDRFGEFPERLFVVIGGDGLGGRDVESRRVGLGRENMALEAEPRRRHSEHAPELAAAQDADRRAGRKPHRASLSVGRSATASLWARRQASSRAASAGFSSARIDRKSTRLNSSHVRISYAVFCLKKKKKKKNNNPEYKKTKQNHKTNKT